MVPPKKKTAKLKRMADQEEDAEALLSGFLAKYTPEIQAIAKGARKKLRSRLQGATELVYDNYNALAIGYGPSERTSEAIISLALYPRWVSLFFLQAKGLRDPYRLMQGKGNVARHIVLQGADDIDLPGVKSLILQVLGTAKVSIDSRARRRLIIKSVSEKQRPRRPAKS